MRMLIAAAAVGLLAGCSMYTDAKLAESAVSNFHDQLDAGQFQAMYDAGADDLKQAATRERFVTLLAAVHRKLGSTQNSVEKGWNVSSNMSGTYVTLEYASTYADGDANEQFLYRLQDRKALLAGYHINSDALITK